MNFHKPSILIVEDDSAMRDLIELSFKQLFSPEYELHLAKDGREALDAIEQYFPRLVILDILLPQINGIQVLQTMREKNYLERCRVLVISALGTRDVVKQVIDGGASDFLIKPLDLDILTTRAKFILPGL